jgi:hypothetical protein
VVLLSSAIELAGVCVEIRAVGSGWSFRQVLTKSSRRLAFMVQQGCHLIGKPRVDRVSGIEKADNDGTSLPLRTTAGTQTVAQ